MVEAVSSLDKKQVQGQPTTGTVQGQGNSGNIFDALGNVAGSFSDSCNQLAGDVARIDLQNSYINRIKMMNTMPPLFCWGGGPIFPICSPSFMPTYTTPMFSMPTYPTFTSCVSSPIMPVVGGYSFDFPSRLVSASHLPSLNHLSVDLPMMEVLGGPKLDWGQLNGNMPGQQPQQPLPQATPSGTTFGGQSTTGTQKANEPQVNIDFLYHPEKYQRPTQPQSAAQTQRPQVTATMARGLGMQERPLWYTSLMDKDPNTLTPEEKRLKELFEKNMIENSVYMIDKNGYIQYDDAGCFRVNANIHSKIKDLYEAMQAHDDVRVLKLIKQYTPEELSAIDYHWRSYLENSKKDKSGLTLRQMAQKSCLWGWADGLKLKQGNYDQIFKVLDEKTLMNNPSSMADAFYQGIHEDSWFDHAIDEKNIIKFLKMLKGNPAYAKAVAEEYGKNFGSSLSDELRNGKLKTNSAEVKRLALEVLE